MAWTVRPGGKRRGTTTKAKSAARPPGLGIRHALVAAVAIGLAQELTAKGTKHYKNDDLNK